MIEIRHLTKKYGSHVAVNDLNLTVEKGKIYGFLGPNGAGKSTTMNMLTGYLAPTEGEVIIHGHDILKEPEAAKRCIGYLPEIPPVYPDMTVGEYLSFVAELKGIKKAERKESIADVMRLVKITDREKQLIKNMSKGYKQRVGLAQAVLGMPDIIILETRLCADCIACCPVTPSPSPYTVSCMKVSIAKICPVYSFGAQPLRQNTSTVQSSTFVQRLIKVLPYTWHRRPPCPHCLPPEALPPSPAAHQT